MLSASSFQAKTNIIIWRGKRKNKGRKRNQHVRKGYFLDVQEENAKHSNTLAIVVHACTLYLLPFNNSAKCNLCFDFNF